LTEWLHIVFRWLHIGAGVMWIGHLWFFNFVNGPLAKTYDADSKKKVLPELMPRALYWFRWGAAWTWITGILLLGLVIYMGGVLIDEKTQMTNLGVGATTAIGLALLVVAFLVYDMGLAKIFGKNEHAGMAVCFVLVVAVAFGLSTIMSGRAMFIHIGAMFGTIMAANVWMRIWPNQRKIIAGVKGTAPAPDPSVPALAGLRSKHNTYMSVPLLLFMPSMHFSGLYGGAYGPGWVWVGVFTAVGWAVTKRLYVMSASPKPAMF